MHDIGDEAQAFLDSVAGRVSDHEFAEELNKAVYHAKQNSDWRHQYMTLYMRDLDNQEIGREEGMAKGIAKGISVGEIKATVEMSVEYGVSKDKTIAILCKKYGLSESEALEKYDQYAGVLV